MSYLLECTRAFSLLQGGIQAGAWGLRHQKATSANCMQLAAGQQPGRVDASLERGKEQPGSAC